MNFGSIEKYPQFCQKYLNNTFKEKLNTRLAYYKVGTDQDINENFVEIFSWTPFTYELVFELGKHINSDDVVFDPCAGSGFHAFVLNQYLKCQVVAIDETIDDQISWYQVKKDTWQNYVPNQKINILLCSWVFQEQIIPLLEKYKDVPRIILVGIYYRCKNARKINDYLNSHYKLISSYQLIPYWGNTYELVEIYDSKSIQ